MEMTMERGNYVKALSRQWTADTLVTAPSIQNPPVTIRPIRADDAAGLHEMHSRLSSDSTYYRYLRPYQPKLHEMEQISRMGVEDGAAFVATAGWRQETIVGVAYYRIATTQADTAEPAILVEDSFQGRGVGSRLWQRLSQHASDQGILYFDALVHPGNSRVFRLLRRGRQAIESQLSYGMREVRISLRSEAETPINA